MTALSKNFYKIVCDKRGCGNVLSDSEHDYWSLNSIRLIAEDSQWFVGDDPLNDPHACFDHWTYCEGCEKRVPLWLAALVNDDLWYCRACDMRLATSLDAGRGGDQ